MTKFKLKHGGNRKRKYPEPPPKRGRNASGERNPYTLRCLLTDIDNAFADGSFSAMALGLNQALVEKKPYRPGRKYGRTIDRRLLSDIYHDKRHIPYYLLEAYTEVLGIPAGVLLLFSRLKAASQNYRSDRSDAGKIPNFLAALARHLQKAQPRSFDYEELEIWAQLYRETTPVLRDQLELPLNRDERTVVA